MKRTILKTILVCAITCSALISQAQRRPAPKPPIKHNAPLDGGVLLLIGAGVLYGITKAYKNKKEGQFAQ